jgi:hypothetical protein
MIKYSLVCENAHEFESWFPDSGAFDTQAKRGFVECPHCGSTKVSKAIMAPHIGRSRKGAPASDVEAPKDGPPAPANVPAAPAPQQVALLDERQQAVRAMIHELHRRIVETSTDVGARFPQEARKMHEGEIPHRSIYGQATLEEAKALVEDGIPVMPIPTLPEERN